MYVQHAASLGIYCLQTTFQAIHCLLILASCVNSEPVQPYVTPSHNAPNVVSVDSNTPHHPKPYTGAIMAVDHPSLIINPNHHYPNYNYRNYYYYPNQSQQKSHPNEQQHPNSVYKANDWTSGFMNNITASVGRNATFECVFQNLKRDFRLAWFHKDRHALLALHDSVIIKNGRISVRSHANTTFYLTIHDIREEDRGHYMCQVNTIPMRSQIGYLEVNVPPSFLEEYTSSDIDIRENSSVNFRCEAKGRPTPEISWRREDGMPILNEYANKSSTPNKSTISVWKGSHLNITNVSRLHMGAFLCIASNGIAPTISKRIFLGVSFAPVIWSNKEAIGVSVRSSVLLECNLESYPRSNVYWQKDDQMPPIIHSDKKYEISIKESNILYRFVVRLKILNVQKSDMGKYTCVAKNMLGEAKTSIQLYEIERKIVKVHKPNYNQARAKSVFRDTHTTRIPSNEKSLDDNANKATERWNSKQETTESEVFDYETNYISPDMNNEYIKENGAPTHNSHGYIICLLLSFHYVLLTLIGDLACPVGMHL